MLKPVFFLHSDIDCSLYLEENVESRYITVLKKMKSFPDYLDYMPEGAITRKLGIITARPSQFGTRDEFLFFSEQEMARFIDDTAGLVFKLMNEKGCSNLKILQYQKL